MKKYNVVCYMRVDPEGRPLTLEEAEKELEQAQFMQPENIYRIEKVEDENE